MNKHLDEIETPLEGGSNGESDLVAVPIAEGGETGPRPEIITTAKGIKLGKCYVCAHFVPLNVIKAHVRKQHRSIT